MAGHAEWRGNSEETREIAVVLARNCECTGVMGMRLTVCAVHKAFDEDQRFLNGLLYMRRWLASHRPGAASRIVFMEPTGLDGWSAGGVSF